MARPTSFHRVPWSVLIVFAALVVCGMASWVFAPNPTNASVIALANVLASSSASAATPSVTPSPTATARTLTPTRTATVAQQAAATTTSTRTPPPATYFDRNGNSYAFQDSHT